MFKRKPKSDKPAKAAKPAKEKKSPKKREKAAKRPAGIAMPIKKPPTDIFTVMLMISLAAVLVACVLLYLELSTYGSYPWWKAA